MLLSLPPMASPARVPSAHSWSRDSPPWSASLLEVVPMSSSVTAMVALMSATDTSAVCNALTGGGVFLRSNDRLGDALVPTPKPFERGYGLSASGPPQHSASAPTTMLLMMTGSFHRFLFLGGPPRPPGPLR